MDFFSSLGNALGNAADNFVNGVVGLVKGATQNLNFPVCNTGNGGHSNPAWPQLPPTGEGTDSMSVDLGFMDEMAARTVELQKTLAVKKQDVEELTKPVQVTQQIASKNN